MKILFPILIAAFLWLTPPLARAQISGLEFLNISPDAKIGDVIAALYVYGVGFVALAALIVFTAGGVMYIFAGDKDPSKAKEWMKNAFWGLVLALTSWLILYTINPALVKNVGDLKLQTIQTDTSSTQNNNAPPSNLPTCSPRTFACNIHATTPAPCGCPNNQPPQCNRDGISAQGTWGCPKAK